MTQDAVVDSGVSWASVDQIVDAIPEGRWTTYGELAAAVGSHPIAIGRHIGTHAPGKAWRVLKANGAIAEEFRWPTDHLNAGRDPRAVLGDEGVSFDDRGRAAADQKLSAIELVQLIGGAALPEADRLIDPDSNFEDSPFAAQLAETNSPATVHGVLELLRHWTEIGGDLSYGRAAETSCFLMLSSDRSAPTWPLALYPRHSTAEVTFQYLRDRPPFDERSAREELRLRLNEVPGVAIVVERLDRRPSFPLDVLADRGRRRQVEDVLTWFRDRVTQ